VYKLYQHKPIKVGFVILASEGNVGHLKTTFSSIRYNYPSSSQVVIVPQHITDPVITEMGKMCPCYRASTTITSMINLGMEVTPCEEWNFITIAGSWIRPLLDRKYSYFIENEKDILFPIVERKMNFVDGSINGILVYKGTYHMIGPMDDKNPLEICKLFWAMDAVDKGCRFKAVLGTRVA
jgi:hypothetical protein